ncbi:MAG: hypothetical protein RLY50_484 [Actinomycetota bacterium]
MDSRQLGVGEMRAPGRHCRDHRASVTFVVDVGHMMHLLQQRDLVRARGVTGLHEGRPDSVAVQVVDADSRAVRALEQGERRIVCGACDTADHALPCAALRCGLGTDRLSVVGEIDD